MVVDRDPAEAIRETLAEALGELKDPRLNEELSEFCKFYGFD